MAIWLQFVPRIPDLESSLRQQTSYIALDLIRDSMLDLAEEA